jgi:hypothetical protein
MPDIETLEQRLEKAARNALGRPWAVDDSLDSVVAAMQARLGEGPTSRIPRDEQEEALKRFWMSEELATFRDARLVSFSVTLRVEPQRLCVIEDQRRFSRLLDGVDHYLASPRQYRRCYQGLLAGYFDYDIESRETTEIGKHNWHRLRGYLEDRALKTVATGADPDWVDLVVQNRSLFSADPCGPYGQAMLEGRRSDVDALRTGLSIPPASWFARESVRAMIKAGAMQSDAEFSGAIPRLLDVLDYNETVGHEGLAMILDRYAEITPTTISMPLRDRAVMWWGNPWLPSNSMRWGRVSKAAGALISDWLKLEFVESFFSLLTEERTGDTRRLEFWKRYVHAIDKVHFALGVDARESRSPDFVELRRKMQGLEVELQDHIRSNNAFVMRIGKLVVVEFSGYSNACYCYDATQPLPFDLTRPVVTPIGVSNSLKHQQHCLKMRHHDGVRGWSRWEEMFEAELKEHFGIVPKAVSPTTEVRSRSRAVATARPPPATSYASAEFQPWREAPYTRRNIEQFCDHFRLHLDDLTSRNGNLWVRTGTNNPGITNVMTRWGFRFKPSKGWWK